MCHKTPIASSPAHTHTHTRTLLRWRKGEPVKMGWKIEDWGGVEKEPRCASWCLAPEWWLILYHLSHGEHTKTPRCLSSISRHTCTLMRAGASKMDDRWLIVPWSPPPHPHPRNHTLLRLNVLDSCLCLSEETQPHKRLQDTINSWGEAWDTYRPPTAASPSITLPRWNRVLRSTFIYLTPRQGRDFICLLRLWLMIVSIIVLKLKDRPWWILRGTEMTDGGGGQNTGRTH